MATSKPTIYIPTVGREDKQPIYWLLQEAGFSPKLVIPRKDVSKYQA